jgi:hypothetical protein
MAGQALIETQSSLHIEVLRRVYVYTHVYVYVVQKES